jgi:hypothetical protein
MSVKRADRFRQVDPNVDQLEGTDHVLVVRMVRLDVRERDLDERRLADAAESAHQERGGL